MALIEVSARASRMYSTSESDADHRAVDGIEAAAAGIDHAGGIDDGDLRAAAHAGAFPRHRRVVLGVDVVGAFQRRNEIVELVLVRDLVDQPDAQRLDRLERSLVDQRAHLRLALAAGLGDRVDELIVLTAIERLAHLLVRGREVLFEVGVDGGLVVADVQEIRIGADPVEGAAQEHFVTGDAGQIERGRRQQVDLVGHRGEEVFAIAAVLEPRIDVLAARS